MDKDVLEKNLKSEIFNYALDIVNTLLKCKSWTEEEDNMVLRYYITDSNDKKIIVIYNSPYIVYELNVNHLTDSSFYTLDMAIKEALLVYRIESDYDYDIDFNKIIIPKKRIKNLKDIYYGIIQYADLLHKEDEFAFMYMERITESFINSDSWKTLPNNISYLTYNMKYNDKMLNLYIDNKLVDRFVLSLDDYLKVVNVFENYIYNYDLVTYGNNHMNKYLSTNNLHYTKALFANRKNQDESKVMIR